jgi:putative Holliday junction resolvase
MGRIIGIDFGTKRVGLAVTDPLQMFASPMETVKTSDFPGFMQQYMKKEQVEAFVVGYPVQMNNKPSESVNQLEPFVKKLMNMFPGIPVHYIDERFTSQIAFQAMISGGVRKSERRDKSLVDKISASIILQSFLDGRQNKTKNS